MLAQLMWDIKIFYLAYIPALKGRGFTLIQINNSRKYVSKVMALTAIRRKGVSERPQWWARESAR